MAYRISVFFLLLGITVQAQVLRDHNFQYQYDPETSFQFNWKVVKLRQDYQVIYQLQKRDTTQNITLSLEFETRESVNEKNGNAISQPGNLAGKVNFVPQAGQAILVAKITVGAVKPKVFYYYKPLPLPVSRHLVVDQAPVINPYTYVGRETFFSGFESARPLQLAYYSEPFPAAAPPFATALAKVSKLMKPDSVFSMDAASSIRLTRKGLYLAQQDTASAEGLAFRVEDDYPKLGKLESLAGPLVYISTKQEAEKLKQVGNDKKKFDQIILTLTGNQERAKVFMRNYFKRVELANQFFSSYKEGWKTDRGMIYIIFGLPEEVYLFEDREVWEYKNENSKIRFQFTKSPTVFDPENYVLIRDKKFNTPWLKMVDLRRKARF